MTGPKQIVAFLILGGLALVFARLLQSSLTEDASSYQRTSASPPILEEQKLTAAGTSQPVKSRRQARARKTSSLSQTDFERQFGQGWTFNLDETGTWRSLAGGRIPLQSITPDEVLRLGQKIAPFLGVPAEQLVTPPRMPSQTEHGLNQILEQSYSGWPVFEGQMRLYVSKANKEVLIIDNDLQGIDEAELARKYSLEEAQAFLLSQHPGAQISGTPIEVLFPRGRKGLLAYQFILETESDDWLILVSAQDLEILLKRSERID